MWTIPDTLLEYSEESEAALKAKSKDGVDDKYASIRNAAALTNTSDGRAFDQLKAKLQDVQTYVMRETAGVRDKQEEVL